MKNKIRKDITMNSTEDTTESTIQTNQNSRYVSRRSFLRKTSIALATVAFGGQQLFNSSMAQSASGQNTWHSQMELAIDFEIKRPSSGRGEKPYVAVWVEDWTGQSVRTLHLWMQRNNGEKYLPELKRWHRNEKNPRDRNVIIRTSSSPTKRPGKYTVIWDGLDDDGNTLAHGDYYICVESARENGPYHLVRGRIDLQSSTFKDSFLGDSELGDVHVEFRKLG